jgi:hypothetical protein
LVVVVAADDDGAVAAPAIMSSVRPKESAELPDDDVAVAAADVGMLVVAAVEEYNLTRSFLKLLSDEDEDMSSVVKRSSDETCRLMLLLLLSCPCAVRPVPVPMLMLMGPGANASTMTIIMTSINMTAAVPIVWNEEDLIVQQQSKGLWGGTESVTVNV